MFELKQSTAVILKLGPFLDDTDGKTAETGLTIAQADIQISKNGGAMAQTSNASPTTTHDADGFYPVPLTTTDTNTLGTIMIQVFIIGTALPVWIECMVVKANIYDTKYSTENYDVNVKEISDDSTAANNAESFFDGTGYAGTNNVIPTVTAITNAVKLNARFQKNTAVANYMFLLVDVTDGKTPETGQSPTCTRSLDAAAFGACANAAVEVASGWYKILLAAADLNADEVVLRFTDASSRNWEHKIRTHA